jgi:hypothetical protein
MYLIKLYKNKNILNATKFIIWCYKEMIFIFLLFGWLFVFIELGIFGLNASHIYKK